jgi:hypothetical protein
MKAMTHSEQEGLRIILVVRKLKSETYPPATASISPSHNGSSTLVPAFIYHGSFSLVKATRVCMSIKREREEHYIAASIAIQIAEPRHV